MSHPLATDDPTSHADPAFQADDPRGGAPMQLTTLLDRLTDAEYRSADQRGAGSAGETFDIPCRANDAELWFAESPADVEFAKALCQSCPARDACLDGAKQRREPWGVWGGELFLAGVVVPRKRPRGRPRKTDVAAA